MGRYHPPEACRDSARLGRSQVRSRRNLPGSPLRPLPKLLTQPPPPWKLPLLPPLPPLPLPKPHRSHWCLLSLRGTLLRLPRSLRLRQPPLPRSPNSLRRHRHSNDLPSRRLAAPSSAESPSASCPSQR